MAQIDQIIDFVIKNRGEQFIIRNNEKCQLVIGGQAKPVSTMMNIKQIQDLVTEVLPEDLRATFDAGENLSFTYSAAAGAQQVFVEQSDGMIQVTIGGQPGAAPASEPVAKQTAPPVEEIVAPLPTEVKEKGSKGVEHIEELFRYMKENRCSDLHLSSNEGPMVRIDGNLKRLEEYEVLTQESLQKILWDLAPESNRQQWQTDHDTRFACELEGVARFRCSYLTDRKGIGAAFRLIPIEIPAAEELGLPKAVTEVCRPSRGLIIVTGPAGSGRSTTLAALVHHINQVREGHIITIEDPIEFVHENLLSLVNQTEVGLHAESFPRALRAALREDPDVVVVGEIRDRDTISLALQTAGSGRLVLAAMHASTAPSAVQRLIDPFPPEQQEQIRAMVSESLVAVIAQTLCRKTVGGRIPAFEVLVCDLAARNFIREGRTFHLSSSMQVDKGKGNLTMNDSLMKLVKDNLVEPGEAYSKAIDQAGLLQMLDREKIAFQPGDG